jgi:hypothetical protein
LGGLRLAPALVPPVLTGLCPIHILHLLNKNKV